jgi:peptidoglycan/LPS O-acetylase OafA/YrhL
MRIRSLDSLRGIAALIVVLHHARLMFPETPAWIKYTPLRVLISGQSAVILFFILSGFVLYLTLCSKNVHSYWSFAIKRFARIYPPFCVAILLSAVLWYMVAPMPMSGVGDWANDLNWQLKPTLSVVLGHLAMPDDEALYSLDNVMWSLVIELRLSLVFPLIAFLVRRNWRAAGVVGIAFSALCTGIEARYAPNWLFDPFKTGQYLYLFVIGAVLAENYRSIVGALQRLSGWFRLALWCSAIICFSVNPFHAGGIPTAIGSTLLVALCLADTRVGDALTTPVPLWLGKISYSLYLIHVPILIAAAHLLIGTMPLFSIVVLALVSAILASEILYRAVESPSIKLGRIATERTSLYRRAVLPEPKRFAVEGSG